MGRLRLEITSGPRSNAPFVFAVSANKEWSLYIIRCGDSSLYTGITVDIQRRLSEHRAGSGGKGAKYLWGRGPLSLEFNAAVGSHSDALKLEHRVKKMSKAKKESLVAGRINLEQLLLEIK